MYSHAFELGGAEKVMSFHAKLFRELGHDVDVFFISKKGIEKYEKVYNIKVLDAVPLFPVSIPFLEISVGILTSRVLLSPLLKKYDVIVAHGYGVAWYIAGMFKNRYPQKHFIAYIHSIPRIFFLDDYLLKRWATDPMRKFLVKLRPILANVFKCMDTLALGKADVLITNSKNTARKLLKYYGLNALVIPPPIDEHKYRKLCNNDILQIYNKYTNFAGFGKILKKIISLKKQDIPIFFTSGRIAPHKGLDLLIHAIKVLSEYNNDFSLIIVGKTQKYSYDYLRTIFKSVIQNRLSDKIMYIKFVPEDILILLYNLADVYVYPVPQEDLGMGVIEAIFCGTPAIAWGDESGPSEIIINGVTGYLAKPYNPHDFAAKLLKAVDLKEKICKYHRDILEKHYVQFTHDYQRKVWRKILESYCTF